MPPTLQRFLLIGTKLIAAAAPAGRVDHEPCLGIPQHPSRVQRLPEAPNPKIGELPGRRQRPAERSGAELAARYVPGQGKIGGDWYDVFTLPTGEHCAVIGDVAGSGLQAAVIMGRMRSTLRSYALETSDPADILGRLDRKMQYFEPGAARSRDRRLPPPIQIGGPLPRPKSRLTSVRFSHQGRFGHSGPDGHGQAGTRA